MFKILDLYGMKSQSELMLHCDSTANKTVSNTIHTAVAHTTLHITVYRKCHKGQHCWVKPK